jgi:hypothetical protein
MNLSTIYGSTAPCLALAAFQFLNLIYEGNSKSKVSYV